MYSCHLFLISSAPISPYYFCPLFCPPLHEMFPWYLCFLKRSLVFPILLFSSIHCTVHLRRSSYLPLFFSGTLHSVGYIFPFFPYLLLFFFPQQFVDSSNNHYAFLHFFFFGMALVTVSYTRLWTSFIVLQALYLQDLIPWIYSSLPLYDQKGFDSSHTWMA